VAQHRIQRPRQLRAGAFQFRPVRQCQPVQNSPAGRSQPEQNFTLVFESRNSRDRACGFKTIHQFNGAVVLDKQPGGDLPDGGLYAVGKALNREQQLMLLRLNTMLLCGCFAEVQELPDLPPELGQIAILGRRKVAVAYHIYIVTRYKLCGYCFLEPPAPGTVNRKH